MTEKECWEKFLAQSGLGEEAKFAGEFGFEARGFAGTERLAALLAGKKTAALPRRPAWRIKKRSR